MACREFEMGKVKMFPAIPLAFLYVLPELLQLFCVQMFLS